MPGDRWERLFSDLEAELSAAEAAELRAEIADRTRVEQATLRLVDRLRPAVGHQVRVSLIAGGTAAGELIAVGADWIQLTGPGSTLVALRHVVSVSGLGPTSAPPGSEGRVGAALDLRFALRRLARDRGHVVLLTADGSTLSGTLDRVGADFVELAEHPVGEPRRGPLVRQVHVVRLDAIALVRSA